jgi:hypothetical protein
MATDGDDRGGRYAAFPATRWSLVGRAGSPDAEAASQSLADLLRQYRPALCAHLTLTRRLRHDQADDLLQGFIARRVLEQNLIARAEQARGRFRWFLLTSLDNYVANELRDARRDKRRFEGSVHEPLGPGLADVGAPSPPAAFDLAWGRQVVVEALKRMEAECDTAGRSDLWSLFRRRVVLPAFEGAEPVPYEQLTREFCFETPAQAANALVTAKRMFTRMLRAVVSEYAEDEGSVDTEIRSLREILSDPRARSA